MQRNQVPIPMIEDINSTICSTINAGIKNVTTCFSDCYAGFFHTKGRPKLFADQSVTKKLKECIELVTTQNLDIKEIRNAIKACHAEVRAAHNETTILLTKHQTQYMIQQPIESYDKNIEQRTTMLDHLSDLLNTYPRLETEDESSLDKLTVFYNERDSHHQTVMTLVETYLPETYAALREAQPMLKS